jgi:hypothetical protein
VLVKATEGWSASLAEVRAPLPIVTIFWEDRSVRRLRMIRLLRRPGRHPRPGLFHFSLRAVAEHPPPGIWLSDLRPKVSATATT